MQTTRPEKPPRLEVADRIVRREKETSTTSRSRPAAISMIIVVLVASIIGTKIGHVSSDGIDCAQTVENDGDRDSVEDEVPEYNAPSYAEMVLRAKVVLYGRITQKYKDLPQYGPQGYTAEMDVYCTLKGRRSQRLVNISFAGYTPTMCTSTILDVGREYIVIAEYNGLTGYRPVDTEIVASPDNLQSAASVCGLHVLYPYGIDHKTALTKCPVVLPPSECLDENHFTTTTTPRPTTTTENDYAYNYIDDGPDSTIYERTSRRSPDEDYFENYGYDSSVAPSGGRIHILAIIASAVGLILVTDMMNSL